VIAITANLSTHERRAKEQGTEESAEGARTLAVRPDPQHASWLNQVERLFSIVALRLPGPLGSRGDRNTPLLE